MSTICLPQATLEHLDRISRDFLWGEKQHLVTWDLVCVPKHEGGLGIRYARNMNKALISKLGWRLLGDDVSLWARVLRSKYKVGSIHERNWLVSKGNWSSTWRSIRSGISDVVVLGASWVIGDGRTAHFWTDKWLGNEPLLNAVAGELPMGVAEACVRDFWRNSVGWDFDRIMPLVTETIRLKLLAVVVDEVTGLRDRLSWSGNSNGEFSVKSAYDIFTNNKCPRQRMGTFFERIWRVTAPERVRLFLWLVGNQSIMTNVERNRRHLCVTSLCQVCKGGEETILHVLRDCPAMSGIWERIVPRRALGPFFSSSLLVWLYGNLGETMVVAESEWSTIFAMACRCGNVFGSNGRCRDRVRFIKEAAKEVIVAHKKLSSNGTREERVERLICWVLPRENWLKLNTDGASHGNPGVASAGGVLRDEHGNWKGGFAVNIGVCLAPLAELWGVYYGLYIAWERRATRVELEVDSRIVVGFLRTGISDAHPLSFLVRLCYGFLSKDWIVRISHVYREANRLADGLANYVFTLPLGFHAFDVCPEELRTLVIEDANGYSIPRNVQM